MPQIFIILSPKARTVLTMSNVAEFGRRIIPLVGRAFDVVDNKHTTFTAVQAEVIDGDADIQIEIRYTTGRNKYGRGGTFNPSLCQQENLIDYIEIEFWSFLNPCGSLGCSLSVWCKPCCGGCFKMFKKR